MQGIEQIPLQQQHEQEQQVRVAFHTLTYGCVC
jgi:hypothetical protein